MRSDLVLSARIESIIWEALAENDLHMLLSAREKFAAELVTLVRDQQAEAWYEGYGYGRDDQEAETHTNQMHATLNPYRQETDA